MSIEERYTLLSRQRAFLNMVLVYLLIFTSGSLRYNQSDDFYLVLCFLVALLAWIVYTDRKISSSFLLYCTVFSGLFFSLSIYTGGSTSLASVLSVTMKMLMAYIIIYTVGEQFIATFLKVMLFIAVISLLGYLSDMLHLFDGLVSKLPNIPDRGHDGIFYVFRDTIHPYRNHSIFFEPGAYQAFLNAALFIIFFFSPEMSPRRRWVYIVALTVVLVTTFSTTGFMIFLCNFTLFLYKSEIAAASGKLLIIGLGIIIVSVFASQFYSSFVKKINDYVTADDYDFSWSAQTRSSQLKADIRVIKKHVFGLGQKKYHKEFKLEGRTDNRGSSNGVTKILAMYGLPIGLFLYGSFFWALRSIIRAPVLAIGAFVMFMLFLGGEAYYTNAPICYALIAAAFVYKPESVNEKVLQESM